MDPLLLNDLTPFIELEQDVQWLALGTEDARASSWNLPDRWRQALLTPGASAVKIAALWSGLEELLPRTLAAYTGKVYGLALLRTRRHALSVVYVFDNDGELTGYRGFAPVQEWPEVASRFPVDLLPLYNLHDGLVQLATYEAGPMPVGEWDTLRDQGTGEPDLVKVALDGPNAFGFDVSENPVQAYAVLSSIEEVEPVAEPWAFLDDLLASRIEDL